jgi:membrane-associated phospholipid phosphatase|uniref:Phosphatidic acid phosphatase type 2/haloperoxidase domain-containing protein n=1 Tax=viral metagenome TaxID=1070528 RepID=A0A6C0ILQ1_9ZZZZ
MELKKTVPDVIIKPITNWTNISHIVTNFVYYVGEYMDSAIFFMGLFTLRKKLLLYLFFFVGLCLCVLLNFVLKKIIRIRRPCINIHLFDLLVGENEEYVERNDKKYHIYGMPSGHSQLCGYAFIFLTLFLRDNYISLFYFLISILTMYQRVKYEHHTVLQVIIGVTIGCLWGVGIYYFAGKQIAGKLVEKEDDNCLI